MLCSPRASLGTGVLKAYVTMKRSVKSSSEMLPPLSLTARCTTSKNAACSLLGSSRPRELTTAPARSSCPDLLLKPTCRRSSGRVPSPIAELTALNKARRPDAAMSESRPTPHHDWDDLWLFAGTISTYDAALASFPSPTACSV